MSDVLSDIEEFVKMRDTTSENIESMVRRAVNRARAEGQPWEKIAKALGLTRQGAMYLYSGKRTNDQDG